MSYGLDDAARETQACLERLEAMRVMIERISRFGGRLTREDSDKLNTAFRETAREYHLPNDPSGHLIERSSIPGSPP